MSLTTSSFAKVELAAVVRARHRARAYETTITRPHLFEGYLIEQIGLLIQNHGMPVRVGTSDTPIPLHFAMGEDAHVEGSIEDTLHRPLRDLFDVPDLNTTDDHIVNGDARLGADRARGRWRRSPRSASTIRWRGSRTTRRRAPTHFQNHVLFTNYQFYMDEFVEFADARARGPGLRLRGLRRARATS